MTTTVSTAPTDLVTSQASTSVQCGITELSVADMARVAGGGFLLTEDKTPLGFILSEKNRIQPLGFILSE